MAWVIGALVVGGVVLELYGLWTIASDVRDAARRTGEIADEAKTVMAASRAVVVDWISRVAVGTAGDLARRKRGVFAIAAGLVLQGAASLMALAT